MPIAILSDDTSRAISSTLVLNDAVSVVKELLDNALDSHSTNITIEISANTLDIIQIKDNGSGIGVEDRQLLCKRNYTSKIRTIEDLAQIGGSSLGFRGEALASIATLSESISFTTRVDGESVATSLKFDSKGKLTGSSSASHSTGTTVRVSNFLKNIPVRRQTVLKDAQRVLENIRRLLFDYAFARPTVRFQFKVLKSASNLKHNWSYVPCKDASNFNIIASKIVGKEIAAQCKQHAATSNDGNLRIEALLINRDCDVAKTISGTKFTSVDERPISAEHGIMKDISKKYKTCLKHAVPKLSNHNKIFMYMRISCPKGFYDVNIEPAKDQVLFEDSGKLMDLFDKVCREAYGSLDAFMKPVEIYQNGHNPQRNEFDLLLARKPLQDNQDAFLQSGSATSLPARSQGSELTVHDLFKNSTGDHILPFNREPQQKSYEREEIVDTTDLNEEENTFSLDIRNPFIQAKLNTRVQPRNMSTACKQPDQVVNGARSSDRAIPTMQTPPRIDARKSRTASLTSPSISPERNSPYQNPGPPNRPWKTRREQEDESGYRSQPATKPVEPSQAAAQTTLLQKWAQGNTSPLSPVDQSDGVRLNSPTHQFRPSPHADTGNKREGIELRTPNPKYRRPAMIDQSDPDLVSPSEEDRSTSHRPSHQQGNTSFLPSPVDTDYGRNSPVAQLISLQRNTSTELDDIMQFEHLKRDTIKKHRSQDGSARAQLNGKRKRQTDVEEIGVDDAPNSVLDGDDGVGLNPDHALRFRSAKELSDEIPEQPNSASYTQNPHWNRRNKAIRDLEKRRVGTLTTPSRQGILDTDTTHDEPMRMSELEISPTQMPPNDSRAYLIRNFDNLNAETNQLKRPNRGRLSRLPFEVTIPGTATFMLLGKVKGTGTTGESLNDVRASAIRANDSDPYIQSGKTIPALDGTGLPPSITLKIWETTCWRLLQTKISSESGTATTHAQMLQNSCIDLTARLTDFCNRQRN